MLGPFPACGLVFMGYLAIVLAALIITRPFAKWMFYTGWIPVFLLALAGVFLELTKGHVCPSGATGIPQCYYSFGMVLACLVLFKRLQGSEKFKN